MTCPPEVQRKILLATDDIILLLEGSALAWIQAIYLPYCRLHDHISVDTVIKFALSEASDCIQYVDDFSRSLRSTYSSASKWDKKCLTISSRVFADYVNWWCNENDDHDDDDSMLSAARLSETRKCMGQRIPSTTLTTNVRERLMKFIEDFKMNQIN